MNAAASYEEAVEQYLDAIKRTRLTPSQPNETLSTRHGRNWRLGNNNGLLATVSDHGEVSLGKETDQ